MNAYKKCLLLPLDGSENSLKALAPAIVLSKALASTLHIIHVSDAKLDHDELITKLGLPREGIAGSTIDSITGDPVEEILRRSENVEYVVMATRGQGGCQGKMAGSVAEQILHRSDSNVLVIPPRASGFKAISRVVVPLDGTPSAADAMPAAFAIARATGASISILHIPPVKSTKRENLEPGSLFVEEMLDESEGIRDIKDEFLDRFVRRHHNYGPDLRVTLELGVGHPSQAIIDTVRNLDADLIVAGWHGTLELGHAQTLKSLVCQATKPLLAIRVGARKFRSRLIKAA